MNSLLFHSSSKWKSYHVLFYTVVSLAVPKVRASIAGTSTEHLKHTSSAAAAALSAAAAAANKRPHSLISVSSTSSSSSSGMYGGGPLSVTLESPYEGGSYDDMKPIQRLQQHHRSGTVCSNGTSSCSFVVHKCVCLLFEFHILHTTGSPCTSIAQCHAVMPIVDATCSIPSLYFRTC